MTFEEWWKNHLPQIQTLRFHPNAEFVKVVFENAYNFGKASAKFASEPCSYEDICGPHSNCKDCPHEGE